MNENAELEPRFIVTVTLDGDDPTPAGRDAEAALEAELAKMRDDGLIRAYTIEQAP